MDSTDTGEVERLRRHLRAVSAVNRQLHAQLEGGTVRLAEGSGASHDDPLGRTDGVGGVGTAIELRRASVGTTWLEQLELQGGGDPRLVRTPKRGRYIIEGALRRRIKSGMIL